MSRPQICPTSSALPSTCFRAEVLAEPCVTHLDSRPEPGQANVTDLVACASAGRRPCFALLHFRADRLIEVDLYFTEAEARACLTHGRTYHLETFALPPSILTSL